MNSRVTMATVAKRAGVHATTVSLALRNHPSLPLATRKRLQALAAEMGYKRDPALSALVAYRRHSRPLKNNPLLAYVTHWDTRWGWKDHPAHRDFFDGASSKATSLGYHLEHFWLGEPGLTHRRLSQILYARGITGIILASHRQECQGALDFEWEKFSGVKIDFAPRQQLLPLVTNDQRTIIALAMQRIMAAGYRRIGCVMPHWWDEFVDLAWSGGFLAEQQRLPEADRVPILYFASPQFPNGRTIPGDDNYVVPAELLSRWMDQYRPEVLVSFGAFVRKPLAKLGLSIPEDIAFVEIFLDQIDGKTAGIRQNCLRVGELAVETLAGQLNQHAYGIPAIPTAILVEGTWFDGESLPRHSATASRETEKASAPPRRR